MAPLNSSIMPTAAPPSTVASDSGPAAWSPLPGRNALLHEGCAREGVGKAGHCPDTEFDLLHRQQSRGLKVSSQELRPGLRFEHGDEFDVEPLNGPDPAESSVECGVSLSADEERAR